MPNPTGTGGRREIRISESGEFDPAKCQRVSFGGSGFADYFAVSLGLALLKRSAHLSGSAEHPAIVRHPGWVAEPASP